MASKNKNTATDVDVDENADADADLSPDELLSKEAEKDRERVLEEDPAISINRRVAESGNLEFNAADSFVNSEKTLPSERASFARRAGVTNHTIAGLSADVHQALVASSNLRRVEAMTYRDIQALLIKYQDSSHYGDPSLPEMPDDVRAHLEDELAELESAAKFDENARTLLEKYT